MQSPIRYRKIKSQPIQKGSGIIYEMLASLKGLLCKCLHHGNYLKVHEVIKMFAMENKVADSLVKFSEQYILSLVMLDLLISSKFDGHMSKRIINMTVERSSVVLDFLYNVWYNVIVHICTCMMCIGQVSNCYSFNFFIFVD